MHDLEQMGLKYAQLTDVNDHWGAALVIANAFGTPHEVQVLERMRDAHMERGYGVTGDMEVRSELTEYILDRQDPSVRRTIYGWNDEDAQDDQCSIQHGIAQHLANL